MQTDGKDKHNMAIEGDIVLITVQEQPLCYARIEQILPDHKPDWYHVTFLLLQIPLQAVTWILRDVYIDGHEFTMGGKAMRIEKVVAPRLPDLTGDNKEKQPSPEKNTEAKVISLKDVKR